MTTKEQADLFLLVPCTKCMGEGKVTVRRELSHDLENCPLCRGDKQIYAVVANQENNGGELTNEIVEAAASLYGKRGITHQEYLVIAAYERASYDARRVKELMRRLTASRDGLKEAVLMLKQTGCYDSSRINDFEVLIASS